MPVVLSSKAYSVYPVSFHDLNFPFELPEDSLIINSCSNGIKTSQDLQNEKNQQNQQKFFHSVLIPMELFIQHIKVAKI